MSADSRAGAPAQAAVPLHSEIRTAGPARLAQALRDSRARSLQLMQAWQQALPGLAVPQAAGLNPPLWEWGHVAWFQEWWTVRNPLRHAGLASRSDGRGFAPSLLSPPDGLYNSSEVAHASRWQLAVPDLQGTLNYLAEVQERSLQALAAAPDGSDASLYVWRLALMHEDMHAEASLYMAQALGLSVPHDWQWGTGRRAQALGAGGALSPRPPLQVHGQDWLLGHHGPGFAFDNECGAHPVPLAPFEIDAQPISWARFVPFLEATGHAPPPVLRQQQGQWQCRRGSQWQPLELEAPAVHVNAHDAQAWCDWAGRRLPSEAEWECAAHQPDFAWGTVWEWTASDFAPYPGFAAHPYADYSAPWWGSHRVLRGACRATSAHVADVRFRNFFTPERRDVFAGFRSVAR